MNYRGHSPIVSLSCLLLLAFVVPGTVDGFLFGFGDQIQKVKERFEQTASKMASIRTRSMAQLQGIFNRTEGIGALYSGAKQDGEDIVQEVRHFTIAAESVLDGISMLNAPSKLKQLAEETRKTLDQINHSGTDLVDKLEEIVKQLKNRGDEVQSELQNFGIGYQDALFEGVGNVSSEVTGTGSDSNGTDSSWFDWFTG